MNTKTKRGILYAAIGAILISTTAIGASYITKESMNHSAKPKVSTSAPIHHQAAQTQPQQQEVASNCDDHNIVGTGLGTATGVVVGSKIGKGSGKTAATIGGAVAGAYLGNQYIPTHNVTCR